MKTYIVFTKENQMVATEAENKTKAYQKVNAVYPAYKSNVTVSSCNIAYCTGLKVY